MPATRDQYEHVRLAGEFTRRLRHQYALYRKHQHDETWHAEGTPCRPHQCQRGDLIARGIQDSYTTLVGIGYKDTADAIVNE